MKSSSRIVFACVLVGIAAFKGGSAEVEAQPACQGRFDRVLYHPPTSTDSKPRISVLLIPTVPKSGLPTKEQWRVIDISPLPIQSGPNLPAPPLPVVIEVKGEPEGQDSYGAAEIVLDQSLVDVGKRKYLLIGYNLGFQGCQPTSMLMALVGNAAGANQARNATPKQGGAFQLAPSTSRENSDIYLSGALDGAKHSSATRSIDAKLSFRYVLKQTSPELDLVPYIDLKTSSNVRANADTLKLGVLAEWSATPWVYDLDGRIEADTLFRNFNGIGAFRVYNTRLAKDFASAPVNLYLEPFAGIELGRNIDRPVAIETQRGVARLITGALAYMDIMRLQKEDGTHKSFLSFSADYTRRWPLLPELSYRKDNSGNLVSIGFGTNPKDYLQTKLQYDLTPQFGFAVGFDYGQLPPSYIKVDQKYSVSLVFKTGLKYTPTR